MINKIKIPDHWEIKRLDEVGVIISGGTPSTKEGENWGEEIIWITPSDLTDYQDKTICKGKKSISNLGLSRSSARLMPKGSVLFSSRAPIGYVVIAGTELCTNQGFKSIIPNEKVTSDFLFHFLKFSKLEVQAKASGTTFKEISARAFASLLMPVPPLQEQHLIVEKIEELFSELDAGRRQLELVKKQLKTYRQAVLKHAFCGKLTDNRIKDGELPESWKIEKFIDFCKIQRGYDLPLKELKTGIFPVVTSGGIKGYHNDFKALGPCLITGRSGGVGNIHYVEIDKYWPHNTVLFVKDFCGNNPKFMYYYFLQFNFEAFSASTTIPTLDRKQLYKELVKVPPVIQQEQIVKEVESRFQVSLRLENAVENAISKVESLKQVILRQAFEGKLVKTQTNQPNNCK